MGQGIQTMCRGMIVSLQRIMGDRYIMGNGQFGIYAWARGESDRAGDQCRVSELLLEAGAGMNVQMNDVKV